MKTPVLFIIFNRPDTTSIVLDAIRKGKPDKLYISADGPRKGNNFDLINCEKTRELTKNIDWQCEVHYRFLDENVGCGWGPASAINWAFETEESLIILEDDCVPSLPFFSYCDYLLEKFKYDSRVWLISGRSHQEGSEFFKKQDYIFSHYGHSWGWATWKRCWSHFDMEMKSFPDFMDNGGAKNVFYSKKEGDFYNKKYKKIYNNKSLSTHVWDFQFGYSVLSNAGLCIVPAKNLIENIGLYGTHSSGQNKFCKLKASDDFKIIKEPKFIIANREFDYYHFKKHIIKVLGKAPLYLRIIKKINKILGFKK